MSGRSRAETALALFCAATVVLLAARDLFVPEIRDVEVWGGFELRGRAAHLTAPLHWAIFALGAFAQAAGISLLGLWMLRRRPA